MRGLLGRTLDVLVEGESKIDASELSGRTSCNRIVNFPAPVWLQAGPGCLIEVTITEAYQNSLRGEVRAAGC